MRDEQRLPYLLIGVADTLRDDRTLWRIQRPDGSVCGADHGEPTDDGILISRPQVREWAHAESAAAYMARLEDGSAGTNGDLPVVWVTPHVPFMSGPDAPHVDGPL